MKVIGLIPARMESSRLPGKPLLDFWGMPMVVHVAKRAQLANFLDDVIICTDSYKIVDVCTSYGIPCCLTSSHNRNGTERIAEAAKALNINNDDIVIDIQGDEPLIDPNSIDNVISFIKKNSYDIVVPYIKLEGEEDINRVKIIDSRGRVLYMSRKNVPYSFIKSSELKKHLSVIGFRVDALNTFADSDPTPLEEIEGIELLRALELGMNVGTFEEFGESTSVDTRSDYERALRMMQKDHVYVEHFYER
ncbi:MAG: 3-deoxy-manno-octulosonate cytidylyltransferase [Methylophaga sp.]|nr:3-deoxy-manno-octulosonate cytidylyltransferase [Methylophaga sp.]